MSYQDLPRVIYQGSLLTNKEKATYRIVQIKEKGKGSICPDPFEIFVVEKLQLDAMSAARWVECDSNSFKYSLLTEAITTFFDLLSHHKINTTIEI